MIAEEELLRPSLRRYPDARRAAAPQLDPVLLPYVALMFGSAVAGVLAFYNAVVVRRFGNAFLSLLFGAFGWIACVRIVVAANRAQVENVVLILLAVRVLHFVIGGVLFLVQRPYVHGSVFLHGSVAPVHISYIAAFAAALLLPTRVLLFLLGVPPGR